MTKEQEETAELLRSGQYYEDARGWYQALYIGPISERAFFMVIAVLAGLVMLVSIIALTGLLPLTEKPGLLIRNDALNTRTPAIYRIRDEGANINDSMRQFMVGTYVTSRESYKAGDYKRSRAYVLAHSDAPTGASYNALYDPSNPRSPAAILGELGQRLVTIQSVNFKENVEPKLAIVKFSTELRGIGSTSKTQWTATLGYYYSPMQVTDGKDAEGNPTVTVEDPQFQVVSYAVAQTP